MRPNFQLTAEQRANAAKRSAEIGRQRASDRRPSAEFDWDRAIAGLQLIFAELDAKDRIKP